MVNFTLLVNYIKGPFLHLAEIQFSKVINSIQSPLYLCMLRDPVSEDGEDPHGGCAACDGHLPPGSSTERIIPILHFKLKMEMSAKREPLFIVKR